MAGGLWASQPASAQDGYLLGWGLNGDLQASPVPRDVMLNVNAFAAGRHHSLAVINGRAWAWGNNDHNQCNVAVQAMVGVTNVAGGENYSLALKNDGSVVAWGAPAMVTSLPASVSAVGAGVSDLAAGERHALALKNGGVIAWGLNDHGQATVPDELTNGVTAIAAGEYFSMGLKGGAVQVFGIDSGHSLEYGIRSVPAEAGSGVTAIAAGQYHALALKNGGVIAWGASFYDATDVPEAASNDVVAIDAGDQTSFALKEDGTLVVWGAVGPEEEFGFGLSPVPSFASTGVVAIAAGRGHCLAVCPELPPRLWSTNLPYGQTATPYAGSVTFTSKPAAVYAKSSGHGWIQVDSNSGAISGIPPTNGNYYFSVAASNVHGAATNQFLISVLNVLPQVPVFLTESPLPEGSVGVAYGTQIEATENPTFSVVSGSGSGLPPGLSLSTSGFLGGTPTAAYNGWFEVQASNVAGSSNRIYSMVIGNPTEAPEFITESPLPIGVVGEPYLEQIEATQGPSFTVWAGSLPDGLTLSASGQVSGTPTQMETANFTVQATNSVGSATRDYSISIFGPPVFITESPLPNAAVGSPYSEQLQATGTPLYSLTGGSVPPGVALNLSGLISGVPSAAGDYLFTVRATNAYGWADREFALAAGEKPVFSTTSPLPAGEYGESYSQQIVATGEPSFSVLTGSLPGGLTLSGAGLLSGTPSTAGSFNFTIQAMNAYGSSNRVFDLDIEGLIPPQITMIRYTNGHIRLEWTNPNAGVDVKVWRATTITADPVPWADLGVQVSPWTNSTPPMPSYYQLRLAP